MFQTKIFNKPHNIKYNLIYYQTPNYIFFCKSNVKAGAHPINV